MKPTILYALISADLASAVVQLSFAKQAAHKYVKSSRRDNEVQAKLWWAEWTYVVNATVGTPGQPVSLIISPSASDTWVPDAHSYECTEYEPDEYCKWGTFEFEESSTYEAQAPSDYSDSYYSSSGFSYDYTDGNYGYGEYFNDVLDLGGVGVTNFSMGLVNQTSRWIGTLGIGYNDSTYSNLPDRLLENGLINSTAYSVWLDDERATTGSLLFGAVDTAKFSGNLTRINASKYSSNYLSFGIYLNSINATTDDSSSVYTLDSEELPLSVSVSPSDSISILPTDIATQIWQLVGATYDEDWGRALIPCDAANSTETFTFQLAGTDGPIIEATMADLVISADQFVDSTWSWDTSSEITQCLFGIQNSSSYYYYYDDYYTLGSTLLRRTYTVFDLVNDEVAVAPVNFGSDESNVVPFPVYGATIPSATLKCGSYGCYTGTATSYTGSGGGSGSGGSGDGDSDSSDPRGLGMPSVPAVVGASLGAGLGALLIAGVVLLILRHRKRSQTPSSEYVAEVVNRGQGQTETTEANESQAINGEQLSSRASGKAPEMSLPTPPPPVAMSRISESEEARRSLEEASGGHGKSTNV